MRINRLIHWLPWLPALLPLTCILIFHIDVPYHDQWDLLPLIDAWYRNTLTLSDLLAPHNGHQLFFPRLIMLALAITTHWQTAAEISVSLLLGGLNYVLLLRLLTPQHSPDALSLLTRAGLALAAFSLAQADNWLWGWQLQVPLCLSAVLSGMLALHTVRTTWLAGLVATVCGIIASGSFAAGMVFWIAALPLVHNRRDGLLWPWIAISMGLIFLYASWMDAPPPMLDSGHNAHLPGATQLLAALAGNVLVILGSLAGRFHVLAAGFMGLLAVGWLVTLLIQARPEARPLWLSLALFSLGTAALVTLSRGGMGLEQMLSSRYTTLMLPLWAVLICQLTHARFARLAGIPLLLAVLATSLYSVKDIQRLHHRLDKGMLAFVEVDTPEAAKALKIINPRTDLARAHAELNLMKQYGLGPFSRPEN